MADLRKIWIYKNQNLLFNTIDRFCDQNDMLNKKDTVILACSGGSDSVFLAHYLFYRAKLIGFSVILAYFDHEWRKESKDEIVFCRNLAQKLGFAFVTSSASVFKEKVTYNGSKEEMAREMRYAFFYEILKEQHAQYIVLAHHLDDQIETFFIRLLRGTSLAGLCGMKAKNNKLVRPLLEITKKEILNWLTEHNISYCVDQSNNDLSFLRNRIRHTLIPEFTTCDDRFTKNMAHVIKRLQSSNDFLELIVDNLYKEMVFTKENQLFLCITQLLKQKKEMQYRILLKFLIENQVQFHESEKFFEEILRFLENEAKKHTCSKKWALIKENIQGDCCNSDGIHLCLYKIA